MNYNLYWLETLSGGSLSKNHLKPKDGVIIVIDNSFLDYEWIVENSKLILNRLNATNNTKINNIKTVKA